MRNLNKRKILSVLAIGLMLVSAFAAMLTVYPVEDASLQEQADEVVPEVPEVMYPTTTAERFIDKPIVDDKKPYMGKIGGRLLKEMEESPDGKIWTSVTTTNVQELAGKLSIYDYDGLIGTKSSSRKYKLVFPVLQLPVSAIKAAASLDSTVLMDFYMQPVPQPVSLDNWKGWDPYAFEFDDPPEPRMFFASEHHGAKDAWGNDFYGEGVNIAIADSGVDFANPDLSGSQAVVNDPASPYDGWPICFDEGSMRKYLQGGDYNSTWYANTTDTVTSSGTWTAAINDQATFDDAETYDPSVVNTWTPATPGNPESYELQGFLPGHEYIFAIQGIDDAEQRSAFDVNFGNDTTQARLDTTPPAKISDLVAAPGPTEGSIQITFTAPGDDDNTPATSAFSYTCRYFEREMKTEYMFRGGWNYKDSGKWIPGMYANKYNVADKYGQDRRGTWIPQTQGSTETFVLTGFDVGKEYWIAVEACDEAGNFGEFASSVSAVAAQDTTPPSSVTGVTVETGPWDESVWVNFTAPSNNGAGTYAVNQYEIRWQWGPGVPYMTDAVFDDYGTYEDMQDISYGWPHSVQEFPMDTAYVYDGWTLESTPNPVPKAPGLQESFVLQVPEDLTDPALWGKPFWGGSTMILGVRAVDEAGNKGTMTTGAGNSENEGDAPSDTTVPQQIADLVATSGPLHHQVTLTWTAPDDDTPGVDYHSCMRYEIRRRLVSQGAITDANWNDANSFSVTNNLVPGLPGTTETFLVYQEGAPGAVFNFAIRAVDETGAYAATSNNPTATVMNDVIDPEGITDLTVSSTDHASAELQFTAPFHDNNTADTGYVCSGYEVRFSTSPINTITAWDAATSFPNNWQPSTPGTLETLLISGKEPISGNYYLTPGTNYYFAVLGYDGIDGSIKSVPNMNDTSDAVIAAASAGSLLVTNDVTPPGGITVVAATADDNGNVTLSWTAPGDDGAGGDPVQEYEVKFIEKQVNSVLRWDNSSDGYYTEWMVPVGTSKSGVYHIGDFQNVNLKNRYGNTTVGILTVDVNTAGVYDTVIIDIDHDYSFADETPANKSNPITTHDGISSLPDGIPDLTGGMIYFISDGVDTNGNGMIEYEKDPDGVWRDYNGNGVQEVEGTPIPYSVVMADRNGIDLRVPGNGELVAFMGWLNWWRGSSHGTLCASAAAAQGKIVHNGTTILMGLAPKAKIIAIGDIYTSWGYEMWYFAVEGYDGNPDTEGDQAQICSNSFGYNVFESGWFYTDRLAAYLTLDYAKGKTLFAVSAGNEGNGYATTGAPGASHAVVTCGAATEFGYRAVEGYDGGPNGHWADIVDFSSRGPSALGNPEPDVVTVGAFAYGALPINIPADGTGSFSLWAGTSLSCPATAGALAQVFEAYKRAQGTYPDARTGRAILMSAADDIKHDVLKQGAGYTNVDRAVKLASDWNGMLIHTDDELKDPFWVPGNYKGKRYEGFTKLLSPGQTDTMQLNVTNHNMTTADEVEVSAEVLEKVGEYVYEGNTTYPEEPHVVPDKLANIDIEMLNIINTSANGNQPYAKLAHGNIDVGSVKVYENPTPLVKDVDYSLSNWESDLASYEIPTTYYGVDYDEGNITLSNYNDIGSGGYYYYISYMYILEGWNGYFNIKPYIPAGTELVRATMYTNDTNLTNLAADNYAIEFFDWTDVDGDGFMDMIKDDDTITHNGDNRSERNRMNLCFNDMYVLGTEISNPLARTHDGVVIWIRHWQGWNNTVKWNVKCEFFAKRFWSKDAAGPGMEWLSIDGGSGYATNFTTTISAGGYKAITAKMTIPPNNQYVGSYEGAVYVYSGQRKVTDDVVISSAKGGETHVQIRNTTVKNASEEIYVNGFLQNRGSDYTYFGDTIRSGGIVFTTPLNAGDKVTANYYYYTNTTTFPVLVNIPLHKDNLTFNGNAMATSLYDNNMLGVGASVQWAGWTTGDKRFFYFDLPEDGLFKDTEGRKIVVDVSWGTDRDHDGTYENDVPSDVNAFLLARTSSPFDVDMFGPYALTLYGGSQTSTDFFSTTGVSEEVVAIDYAGGLNVLVLNNRILSGNNSQTNLTEFSISYMNINPTEASIATNSLQGQYPFKVSFTRDWDGINAIARGPTLPDRQNYLPIYQDDIDLCSSSFIACLLNGSWSKHNIVVENALRFDVHIWGDSACPDLDLGVFRDDNEDGYITEDEFMAYGADWDADEEVKLITPPNGKYHVYVLGYTVNGANGSFDYEEAIVQGNDFQMKGVPDQFVEGGNVSTFYLAWDLNENYVDGNYKGLVFVGPKQAAMTTPVPIDLVIERVSPVFDLERTKVPDGSVITDTTPDLSTTFEDKAEPGMSPVGIDPNTAKFFIDGIGVTEDAVATAGSITYTPPEPLTSGEHLARAEISDLAGNMAFYEWDFTIDITAPNLMVEYPATDMSTSEETITTKGRTDSGVSLTLENSINGGIDWSSPEDIFVTPDGSFSHDIDLSEITGGTSQEILFRYTAEDEAGNIAQVTRSVTTDVDSPTVSNLKLSTGSVTNEDQVFVSGKVKDSDFGRASGTGGDDVAVYINNEIVLVRADGSFSGLVALEEGENTIEVLVVDGAENSATITRTVTRDTTAPLLSVALVEDPDEPVVHIVGFTESSSTLSINGKPVMLNSTGLFMDDLTLSRGMNVIYIESKDAAGNVASFREEVAYGTEASFLLPAILMVVLLVAGIMLGLFLGVIVKPEKEAPAFVPVAEELRTCPNCGAIADATDTMCRNCQAPLEEAPPGEGMMCPVCGMFVPPGSTACLECGTELEAAPVVVEEEIVEEIKTPLDEADELLEAQMYDDALAKYEEILLEDPQNSRALVGKALAMAGLDKWGQGLQILNDILKDEPNHTDALLAKAKIFMGREKYEQAIAALDQILEIEPEHREALVLKADALRALGREEEADEIMTTVEFLEQVEEEVALEEPSGIEAVEVELMEVDEMPGEIVEAEYPEEVEPVEIEPVVEEVPEAVPAGEVTVEPIEAEPVEELMVEEPTPVDEAKELIAAGDYDGAIAKYDEILAQDPENDQALIGKAVALHKADKWGQALQSLNTILKANPDHEEALLEKGRIFAARGKTDMAVKTFDQILEKNPENQKALAEKAKLLEK